MPYNGSGSYSLSDTLTNATTNDADEVNLILTDIATALSNAVTVDGQSTMTGVLKASNGSAAAPSYTFGSDTNTGIYRKAADSIGLSVNGTLIVTFDSAGITLASGALPSYAGTVGGTNNAITITSPPAGFTLAAGAIIVFVATASNSAATTINAAGTGVKNAFRSGTYGAEAMIGGEIISGGLYVALYDGTQFQVFGVGEAVATVANYRAATTKKILSAENVWAAAAIVALTDGASIALDMSLGFNFSVTLAGNRTLANPTNTKVGQAGMIRVSQDGTGTRTLAYGSSYKFVDGTAPTIDATASRISYLSYFVYSSTEIVVSMLRGVR